MSSTTFLQERLTAKKAQLAIYDAAVKALNSNVEHYDLDTGQSRQRVTRTDMARLQSTIRMLETDICLLENRLNGCGAVVYGKPSY